MPRGLLLCGGASTRFGSNKLLEVIAAPSNERPGDELPMAGLAARALVSALGRVIAVVRPGQPEVRALLEAQGCEIVETPRALEGLGASLAAGVAASPDDDGWIVALGDMPFIDPLTIRAVATALENGALIAAPVDASGRRGHPVGFARGLRNELASLAGDDGARGVIERHHGELRAIRVDDPGIFRDIDRREDLH